MKDFDLEKLERKNIYKIPDNLFENIQGKVLSGMNDFDLEKLERKNIYTVPENLFETVQENVMNTVLPAKKAPVFKLNWAYAAAASLALIFGATFVFNNGNANEEAQQKFAVNNNEPKTESQIAYETLESDLTSVENNNQTISNQGNKEAYLTNNNRAEKAENDANKTVKPVSTQKEVQMNEYLDNFSTSEIAELASNSTQDVYLDLYN
jgi:hypothetical protein